MGIRESIALLRERFVHRDDVFALQWFHPEKGVGYRRVTTGVCTEGCPKRACPHVKSVPLSDEILVAHLKGEETVGIFQLTEDNTVKWLCFDVDVQKGSNLDADAARSLAQQHTKKLAAVLHRYGVPFLVEESGSKGYHLWTFFSEPVQARKAMALGRYVEGAVPPPAGLAVEIFPKQTAMRSYGNLVKLPLGVHKKTGKRCFFVANSFAPYPPARQFDLLADAATVSAERLDAFLARHKVEVPTSIRMEVNGGGGKSGSLTPPCLHNIMREGLRNGMRDVGAHKLGCYWRDRGATMEMTFAAFDVWNRRNDPPLDADTLAKKVESAYAEDYSHFPCSESLLDPMCESSCRFFPKKVQDRWTRYGKKPEDAVGKISRN